MRNLGNIIYNEWTVNLLGNDLLDDIYKFATILKYLITY